MLRGCTAILAAALLAGGCAAQSYNLRVALSPAYAKTLGDERIFIHVVPVTAANRWDMEAMSLDGYWQYRGQPSAPPARIRDTRMFELSAIDPSVVLNEDDPVWSAWRQEGAEELMVLSSRPVPLAEAPGERDPRRRFLPPGRPRWTVRDLRVVVSQTGLNVEPPSKTK